MRFRSIAALGVLLLQPACIERAVIEQPTEAIIDNQSSVRLTEIKLRSDGFIENVPDLEPGQRTAAQVMAHGESGVAVSFVTDDGRTVRTKEEGYFEGNGLYVIRVTVNVDLSVSVRASLKSLTGEER